jgi:hypothetical protein
MLAPRLSNTVPGKLPVAWPYEKGEIASANAQTILEESNLVARTLCTLPLLTPPFTCDVTCPVIVKQITVKTLWLVRRRKP